MEYAPFILYSGCCYEIIGQGGNMANCEKCGLKLNFSNNFGGICEGCYNKRLREEKGK